MLGGGSADSKQRRATAYQRDESDRSRAEQTAKQATNPRWPTRSHRHERLSRPQPCLGPRPARSRNVINLGGDVGLHRTDPGPASSIRWDRSVKHQPGTGHMRPCGARDYFRYVSRAGLRPAARSAAPPAFGLRVAGAHTSARPEANEERSPITAAAPRMWNTGAAFRGLSEAILSAA
jgi:hypothetical protein